MLLSMHYQKTPMSGKMLRNNAEVDFPRVGVEVVSLRFQGEEEDGAELRSIRAEYLKESIEGLIALSNDIENDRSKTTHGDEPLDVELFVRPPKEGSFVIEAFLTASTNPEAVIETARQIGESVKDAAENAMQTAENHSAITGPALGVLFAHAVKKLSAHPKDVQYVEDGHVKINWQDDTVDIVPEQYWFALQKLSRRKRTKKQLRKIMKPLEDPRVQTLEVRDHLIEETGPDEQVFKMNKADYVRTAPQNEDESWTEIIEIEGKITALDFNKPDKWRVSADFGTRAVKITDSEFLRDVEEGMKVSKDDLYRMMIVVETTIKNDRKSTTYEVVRIARLEDGGLDGQSS